LIKNSNTKLILYTYDAFLFDKDNKEEELMESIYKVFNKQNLNIKVSYGKDYDSLQRT
jgi:hypothetical protein